MMTEQEESKQLPAKQEERVPVKFKAAQGFDIQSLEEAYRFGKYVAVSGFYPALKKPEQVVVALQLARDARIPFSLLAANIAFINGRATMYGDALIGAAYATGEMEDFKETFEGEGDLLTAVCDVKRKGIETRIVRRFGVADAKAAELLGKDTYKKYLKRMLQMRARSWALRDAGLVQGIIGSEEAEDIRSIEVEEVPSVSNGKKVPFGRESAPELQPQEVAPENAGPPEPATPDTPDLTSEGDEGNPEAPAEGPEREAPIGFDGF